MLSRDASASSAITCLMSSGVSMRAKLMLTDSAGFDTLLLEICFCPVSDTFFGVSCK